MSMDYFDSRDFLIDDEDEPLSTERTEITRFFDGTNILITGGTGFIGCLILEKLLRCCPGIKQVFLLIRTKKGKTEGERIQELLKDSVFDELWKINPDFPNKIKLIPGDCSLPQLGLSPESKEKLLNVNIIFHSAALLQFGEHLRNSFHSNVSATCYLLELAKEIKNFKAFTYVSTAFAHIEEEELKEEFYKPKFNFYEMKSLVDNCTDEEITALMPILLGNQTTYSFTKCISEDVVRTYKDVIPVGIVRPSIILNTFEEPLKSWTNTLNGHSAILLGLCLGVLHVLRLDINIPVDIVPADKVTSAIIACTWDVACNKRSVPIYNVVSWKKNVISWSRFKEYINYFAVLLETASEHSLWTPFNVFTKCQVLYSICFFLFHIVRGFFVDTLLQMRGEKPRLMKIYRKFAHLWDTLDVYVNKEWHFDDENLYRLWDEMAPDDKRKFNFSLIEFSWRDYMYYFAIGLKKYILKDSFDIDCLAKARRHKQKLIILNRVAVGVIILLSSWLISYLVKNLILCY